MKEKLNNREEYPAMLKLFKYLKRYIWWVVLAFALLFGQAMADLALPDYMSSIVSEGIAKSDLTYVWQNGLTMLLISLAGGACAIMVGFVASKVGAGIGRDLRSRVFDKVTSFSNPEFDKFSVSSLITRSTNDITQLQTFFTILIRMVIYAPIMGIGGILKAGVKSSSMPGMNSTIVVPIIIIVAMIVSLMIIVMPRFKVAQKLLDKLNLVARERLSGLLVIRAFNTDKHEEERFDDVNKQLTSNHLFVNRMMSLMMPVMNMIMNGVSLAVVWIAAVSATNIADVGNMMAFMQYAVQIIMSFMMVSMVFVIIPRAAVSANRIVEVLETEVEIKDDPSRKMVTDIKNADVSFENVSFSYPGAQTSLLENISFTAKQGQTTAFIGPTGSGKSTLISLIPRLYDATSGKVTIGGVDVRDIPLESLHKKIGYVPQKGMLFSGTIESNIKYGNENATEAEIAKAAEVAQSTDFIAEAPQKMQTPVAQGGTSVSGGQKQRLSIARALATKAPVLIFDDSFSALDFKTDSALRHALANETKDRAVLIVAQRVSTIMNAEQIIVVADGAIVGRGTHNELLKSCELYLDIARSQLSQEEIDNEK